MDSGIPSTPLTEIIQGAKFDRIYGTMEYYTIISYEWVQFAFHSEANTSTTPKTFEFKTSLSQKITRSAGASINATLKGFGLSLTGSIAYEDSTELTITVPLTVGSMEKLDYYRYQLVATYIVYEVWTPFYTSESTTTAFYQTTVPLLSSAGREVRYKWETPPQE